jgi:hypothetical protein
LTATLIVAIICTGLLWFEWRYRRAIFRFAAIGVSLLALFFSQPSASRAARRALSAQASERVTHVGGQQLSEFATGVRTAERAFVDDRRVDEAMRLVGLITLLWLACTPTFRPRD